MGLKLAELDEYFDPGMELTVLGVEYVVPPVSAAIGLWCRRISSHAGADVPDEDTTGDELVEASKRVRAVAQETPAPPGINPATPFEVILLGTALDEMVANDVPDPYVQFCAQTHFWRILGGDKAAERYWTSGGNPQPAGPANRQERRAVAKAKPRKASGSRTTGTAAARTTRSRASGTGTSTPKPSVKNAPAKRSRGTRSSGIGV